MLLMPNKKNMVSLIIASKKGEDSDFVKREAKAEDNMVAAEKGEQEKDSSYALLSSMEAFLAAVKRDDAEAMGKALKEALLHCEE